MLEMSGRESSDVWRNQQPAHKAPGRVEVKEPRSRKSVYRSSSGMLTGGLTIFSRSPVLAEFRCYAIGHRAAVNRQRDMWINCYTVELEILPRTTITPWQSITQ